MEDKAQQADGPVDYKALKAWIAAQEAYEIANSRPAPLTPAQKNALVKLGRSIPANGVIARPEIGDSNWIGDLNGNILSHGSLRFSSSHDREN